MPVGICRPGTVTSYDVGDDANTTRFVPVNGARTVPPPEEVLPLREGDCGDAVADLQDRLGLLGYEHGRDDHGVYGPATAAAVHSFQSQRGLRADGVCGAQTWSSLVEAGFRLGDRLLYRRSPMLQGDDIAEVQRRLSGLGFDPGGVDGIFGESTHIALAEFQRNVGLATDGICGPRTLSELTRVAPVEGGADLVSPLREQLKVAASPTTLREKRIAIGEEGGFANGRGCGPPIPPCGRSKASATSLPGPDGAGSSGQCRRSRLLHRLAPRADPRCRPYLFLSRVPL